MKIAVVANGISLVQMRCGREIDSSDLVIRMNEYYRLRDQEVTGLKCDIWSCCFNNNTVYDDHNIAKEVWVARPLGWDNENHAYWTVPEHARKRMTHEAGDYGKFQVAVKNEGGTNPTTGFITVFTARDKYPDAEFHVYGYDFYATPQCYYEATPQCRFVHHHSPNAEKKIIQRWHNEGLITYHGTF